MPIATPQGTLDFKSVDTITFVGASSNTVIDTTTGSLGVGVDVNGPTSNLHVVGNALITGNVAVTGTGALTVPSGTAEQQPTGVNGMIRYNSTTGYMEAYSAAGWGPFGFLPTPPPTIASISPLSTLVTDTSTQVFTVTGTGITNGSTIELVGADGTNYDVVDTTAPNAAGTQITFKLGDLTSATAQLANRPYRVKVNSTSGLSAASITTIGLGSVTWSSPAASSINNFPIGASTTLTLSATDGLGGSGVTYSLSSGTYLSGTFNIVGNTITGTTNAAENATTSVTIRAKDTKDTSIFSDRTFTLKAIISFLYTFSKHTFTYANRTIATYAPRAGPTFAEMKTAYASEIWEENPAWFNSTTRGFQIWTVPRDGTYRIIAKGGRGGSYNATKDGLGGEIEARFVLTKGTKLVIIVGEKAASPTNQNGGGGGGGASWVLKENFQSTDLTDIYVIAGGGGGGHSTQYTTTTGNAQLAASGIAATGGAASGGHPGAGSGAGYSSNGNGTNQGDAFGVAPFNGAQGGTYYGNGYTDTRGGFGGGGSGRNGNGGGGGGYAGGNADYYNSVDNTLAGGKSFVSSAASYTGSHSTHTDQNGSVYIELYDATDPIISQPATANRYSKAFTNPATPWYSWDIFDLNDTNTASSGNGGTMPTPTGPRVPTVVESVGYPNTMYGRWYYYNGSTYADLGRRS